jgi:hypothetical protein
MGNLQALCIDAQVPQFAHPKENTFVPDQLIPNTVKTGIVDSAAEMPTVGAPSFNADLFNPDNNEVLANTVRINGCRPVEFLKSEPCGKLLSILHSQQMLYGFITRLRHRFYDL